MKNLIFHLFLFSIIFVACDPDDKDDDQTIISTKVNNLAADPGTGFDPMTGAPLGTTGLFTLFSLADSAVIDNNDSASLKWDIGFRGSRIIINSGTSGPGSVGAFLQSGIFSDINEVSNDSIFKIDQAPSYAIGNTWSTYNPATLILAPTIGKSVIIRTNQNQYCKLEILSYYKDAPAAPDAKKDLPRYYTFQYVLQKNGSKSFK